MFLKVAYNAIGIPNRQMAWSSKCGPKSFSKPAPGCGNSLCGLLLKAGLNLSKLIVTSIKSPTSFSLIIFCVVKKSLSHLLLWYILTFLPTCAAIFCNVTASFTVVVKAFSTTICLPACNAFFAYSKCVMVGVFTIIKSIESSSSKASRLLYEMVFG